MRTTRILKSFPMLCAFATLAACGGGGGGGAAPQPSSTHQVAITWTANREADVNTTGGGYQVSVSGYGTIDVPYPAAPGLTIGLVSGQYRVTVTAYSATSPITGLAAAAIANYGRPSTTYTFNVP